MPFGLMNAPSVFQQLMQPILSSINHDDGPSFVIAYMNDLLVFSSMLAEHLDHLRLVLEKLRDVGLKFNPSKYCFRSRILGLCHNTLWSPAKWQVDCCS